MPDISNVRRNILLLMSGAIVVALGIFVLITPSIIYLSPQVIREARSNLAIFAPVVSLGILGATFLYLQPIDTLANNLKQGQTPPTELAQKTRTRALNASLYLFCLLIGPVGLLAISFNLYGLVTDPHYAFVYHFSHSLLLIAATAMVALTVLTLSRRILRPVLVVTADLAEDVGHRYTIRLRLALVVLSLNFIIFYFLGVLAFNQIYQISKDNVTRRFQQWGQDVTQAAPYLDRATFIKLISEADILTQYDATLILKTPEGEYLLGSPDTTPSLNASAVTPGEPIEQDDRIILRFPIERPAGTWQLDITFTFALKNVPFVHNTILTLLIFGVAILGLTLVTTYYLVDDITRDIKYVTARLLDIARQGHVGEKVRTLSIDEVGDLIIAFDKVRQAVVTQQKELSRRVEQTHQLHQASLALTESVNSEQMLDRICQVAREITASDNVTLYLYIPDKDRFVLSSQVGEDTSRLELAPMNHTLLQNRQPILVHDTQNADDETLPQPLMSPEIIESGIRSLIAVPVISREQMMGALYVNSCRRHAYNKEDLQMVATLASQAAAAIENARLLEETLNNAQMLEQRARNLQMINRISADLTSLLDPYQIFKATAQHLVELMEIDHCGILIFDESATQGVVVAEYPEMGTVGQRLPRTDNPAIEQVMRTKQPLAIKDIHQAPMLEPVRDTLTGIGVRAILIAPLIARDQVMGTIRLDVLHKPYEFSIEEQELCRTIAAQAAIAASNARLLYDLQQQRRALTRKSQELAEESAKLDAVLTNMADGLVVTDLLGRIMLANPGFKAIAGLPLGRSLRGRLLSENFASSALQKVIAKAVSTPDQIAVADLDMPDGRVIQASASALHMKQDADPLQAGQVTGVVTLLRDITHEVEVDRIKTEFISAVSHELRTPLTSILGFANLIQREFRRRIAPLVADDSKARRAADRILENLTIIETESQRLTELINDVLDIAKMEAGRAEWHMKKVDIADIANTAINTISILADEQGLTLKSELHTPLPAAWGDEDRLVQVLTNLLSNAIKFTNKGGITVESWAWTEASAPPSPHAPKDLQAPALVISVTDTGIGIAQKDLPLVFERFRQVGDTLTEKPKGTGLGLSICKEIIEHHQGKIWVESQLKVGSTFYFTLPIYRASDSGSTEQTATPQPAAEKPSSALQTRAPRPKQATDPLTSSGQAHPQPIILVVDDEPHIRQLLHQELTNVGYQVIEAADGDAALSQARSSRPDLVVLDVMMPRVSGFGVVGALRADPDTHHIPIVILSIAEESKRALELGANACLTKPVDLPRLLNTIEQLLKSSERQDE